MLHSGGYKTLTHHQYCRATGGVIVGIKFHKNAIPVISTVKGLTGRRISAHGVSCGLEEK